MSLPFHLSLQALNDHETEFNLKEIKEKNKCTFVCQYFISEDCWKCNCGVLYFSGIPCSHLLRVVHHMNGSIEYYINSRWLIPDKNSIDNFYTTKIETKIEDRFSDHVDNRSRMSDF